MGASAVGEGGFSADKIDVASLVVPGSCAVDDSSRGDERPSAAAGEPGSVSALERGAGSLLRRAATGGVVGGVCIAVSPFLHAVKIGSAVLHVVKIWSVVMC